MLTQTQDGYVYATPDGDIVLHRLRPKRYYVTTSIALSNLRQHAVAALSQFFANTDCLIIHVGLDRKVKAVRDAIATIPGVKTEVKGTETVQVKITIGEWARYFGLDPSAVIASKP